MRKRSGALHCDNQEEFLKLAEEQQKQSTTDLVSSKRGRNLSPLSERNRSSRSKPVYEMSSQVDLNGKDSPIDSGSDFDENRVYDIGLSDVMVVSQFGSTFLPQLSSLDSSGSCIDWPAGSNKDKMLDLIIAIQPQQDSTTNLVFKIWIHNTISSKSPSFHTHIIQSIHYARCQHFIFLYEENEYSYHDILRSYEKVQRIKENKFHATFIAVTSDKETESEIDAQGNAANNTKYTMMNTDQIISNQLQEQYQLNRKIFLRAKPRDLPELMRDVLKNGYKYQESIGELKKKKDYSLEKDVPISALLNTRSISDRSNSSSSNSSGSEEFAEEKQTHSQQDGQQIHSEKHNTFNRSNGNLNNSKMSAGEKVLAELKINWKANIILPNKIPEKGGDQLEDIESKQNYLQRWTSSNGKVICKMKGSKSQDLGTVRISKHTTRSLSREPTIKDISISAR